jgi:hypothetical protein
VNTKHGRPGIPRKEMAARHTADRSVEATICSSSYGGSFSIFSYAYASQSYDAYAFYHKAYSMLFLVNK